MRIAPHSHRESVRGEAVDIPLAGVLRHNTTQIAGETALAIMTPDARWAYAAEFPICQLEGPLTVRAELRVDDGLIGLACLNAQGEIVSETEVGLGDASPAELGVAAGRSCTAILLRNCSEYGASATELTKLSVIRGVEPALPEIVVDAALFNGIERWSGVTPAGYWSDWLGTRTRADVWDFPDSVLKIYSEERADTPDLPIDHEHVLDWAPLIEAVTTSGPCSVTVALGSGWGRWIVAAAAAAKKTGRDYRVVGVEAEPTHFGWMERHFADNDMDPARSTLMQAAASDTNGLCWFQTGSPADWYGQSIISDDQVPDAPHDAPLWSEVEAHGVRLKRVRSVDLRDIAAPLPPIDYMHMDIQGSEADFLEACADVLQQRVRTVNVGTHSADIERRLRRLFTELGWKNLYDIGLHSSALVRVGDAEPRRIDFGDGVQVWRNPALG